MQRKAFVYKLRPTKAQAALLSETLETCRRLYNDALHERKTAWEERHESLGFARQCAALPAKKIENAFLARIHSQVAQDVLHRVDVSFQTFFRRRQRGETPGYPRFKGRGWYDSFTYPQWRGGTKFREGRLMLSKIGSIRVSADRPLHGTPKTCTIRRRVDGWYACIVCEYEPCPWPETGRSVGIDLGIESFATLDTGERIPNPRPLKHAQRRLKCAQRRLSRRVKGSNRRRKARVLLAKAHLRVQRARLDFGHKAAHDLVSRYDTIHVEKLNIRGMLKNHPLAQAISDAGWGLFLAVLRSKAESAGRRVVEVDPRYTSQDCSACGGRVPKKLSERWHSCPYCGFSCHRDENAARNTKKKGGGTAFGEQSALALR
jgi:putative transposase